MEVSGAAASAVQTRATLAQNAIQQSAQQDQAIAKVVQDSSDSASSSGSSSPTGEGVGGRLDIQA
ncbi:MAG: hypothetical protein JKY49_16425 [Cohaesibacteraceae bacterium]|nr:hypothetical protein [Cohaesibacteraceae bacterium]